MKSVNATRVIKAPAARVWKLVRDFARIDRIVPQLPSAIELSGDPELPGAERRFRIDGEIAIIESLVTLDDEARLLEYSIRRAPLPIENHLAQIRVTDRGDHTLVVWQATFEIEEALAEDVAQAMLVTTFEPGLQSLAELTETS